MRNSAAQTQDVLASVGSAAADEFARARDRLHHMNIVCANEALQIRFRAPSATRDFVYGDTESIRFRLETNATRTIFFYFLGEGLAVALDTMAM